MDGENGERKEIVYVFLGGRILRIRGEERNLETRY